MPRASMSNSKTPIDRPDDFPACLPSFRVINPAMTTAAAATETRVRKVALIGNPNAGKSTLFNALAGMNARVGNYPGVTVEKKIGRVNWNEQAFDLIDLPGTYSLSPRSPDEMVSVDVLLGRQPDVGDLDAVICIVDSSNLERHLYLVSQILDVGMPVVLVLNMWDAVAAKGLTVDVEALQKKLDIPVITTEAHRRKGVDAVRNAVEKAVRSEAPARPKLFPPVFYEELQKLGSQLESLGVRDVPFYLQERLLLDVGGTVEQQFTQQTEGQLTTFLTDARQRLKDAGCVVPFAESESRYRWARELLHGIITTPAQRRRNFSDRIDAVLTHRVLGLMIFATMMFLVFQTIFTWATPLMKLCDAGKGLVADLVTGSLSPGPLRSLLVDGVIEGVGGVVIFLPQIVLLFFFIALMEDCGYMARAAYMMDRFMAAFGLSGKSFLPLMSSFACAVPGVMATRTIDNSRDRLVTILVAPLMSCSARLPVYLLLIAAILPTTTYLGGWVSLSGLVLFAMVSLGIFVAIPVAWLLKKTLLKGEPAPFLMELPDYKMPSPRLVLYRVYDRGKAFVVRAGTLIFAATIVIWAGSYFPGDHTQEIELTTQLEDLQGKIDGLNDAELTGPEAATRDADVASLETLKEPLEELLNAENASLIQNSALGRMGQAIEPAVKPLGWDWKIGVGAIASFPAREVFIATMGTIYSLGGDVDEESPGLQAAIKSSQWPDGTPVYNVPVAMSIMVFFALCAQCVSTLVIIRRETNSWRWPIFSFSYMTVLAYVGALLTYQIGARIAGL